MLTIIHVIRPEATIPKNSIDRADRRNRVRIADALRQQLVTNFPRKNARIFLFEAQNFLYDCWRCDLLEKYKCKVANWLK